MSSKIASARMDKFPAPRSAASGGQRGMDNGLSMSRYGYPPKTPRARSGKPCSYLVDGGAFSARHNDLEIDEDDTGPTVPFRS